MRNLCINRKLNIAKANGKSAFELCIFTRRNEIMNFFFYLNQWKFQWHRQLIALIQSRRLVIIINLIQKKLFDGKCFSLISKHFMSIKRKTFSRILIFKVSISWIVFIYIKNNNNNKEINAHTNINIIWIDQLEKPEGRIYFPFFLIIFYVNVYQVTVSLNELSNNKHSQHQKK